MSDSNVYMGTKVVIATPMTRGKYNEYRGWECPGDENPADAGYLVEYLDGGQPNHPAHKGYISWSPEAVFDKAYIKARWSTVGLHDYQVRVICEASELWDRRDRLQAFLESSTNDHAVSVRVRRSMYSQLLAMNLYLMCLEDRISNF